MSAGARRGQSGQPMVSLVVPVYNEEALLEGCLCSLRAQSFADFELIVVDNGCSDGSVAIATRYADSVLFEPTRGYPAAVEKGIGECGGYLVAVCDADARYAPQWLEAAVHRLQLEPNAVAVYGPCRFHDYDPVVNALSGVWSAGLLTLSRFMGRDCSPGPNCLMRKSAYLHAGGYASVETSIMLDCELANRLKKTGLILLDSRLVVRVSARRIKTAGWRRSSLMAIEAWLRLVLQQRQRVSYAAYNAAFHGPTEETIS